MKTRVLAFLGCLLFLTLFIFDNYPITINAQAAGVSSGLENVVNFDNTNVLDDLSSSNIDGQPFNLGDYPYNATGELSLVTFVEYCYSADSSLQSNYALYLFVYNPADLYFNTASQLNKVQMASAYNEDGTPSEYAKYPLKYCNRSTLSGYANLFYKFKVADISEIVGRVEPAERRYDISGIELVTNGKQNATEYAMEWTYKYTGFAAGYGGEGEESTLSCELYELETQSSQVHHTYYNMPGVALTGNGHKNQVSTVYFSIPNNMLSLYGRLQKIHAEWWEYKTSPIVVTSNWNFYDYLWAYRGQKTASGHNPQGLKYGLGLSWDNPGSLNSPIICYYDDLSWNQWGPNPFRLTYLFHTYNNLQSHIVPGEQLLNYIYNYSRPSADGFLPIKNKNIAADLFAASVDEGRQRGYNNTIIDADSAWDLRAYSTWYGRPGGIGWFLNPAAMLLWSAANTAKNQSSDFVHSQVSPIVSVDSNDLSGFNRDIAERLLIAETDVAEFKDFYTQETSQNKTVFLFRFAVTDYFHREAHIIEYGGGLADIFDTATAGQAYVAQQTVFFDFDIIDFTFNKDGVYTVIPVVNSPIDAAADIVPPPLTEEAEDWTWAIKLLLLVLLIVICWRPIEWGLNKVVGLIPFKDKK